MPIDDGCFEASVTQLGEHVSAGQRPAEQSTRAGGEDAGHVQPADPGRDVGDVAGPQLVQLAAAEASVREVIGRTSIWELLPKCVAAVAPVPVLASGGIGDGAAIARRRADRSRHRRTTGTRDRRRPRIRLSNDHTSADHEQGHSAQPALRTTRPAASPSENRMRYSLPPGPDRRVVDGSPPAGAWTGITALRLSSTRLP